MSRLLSPPTLESTPRFAAGIHMRGSSPDPAADVDVVATAAALIAEQRSYGVSDDYIEVYG